MTIVSVSHYYPPHIGGLEVVAKRQAESLCQAGHCVVVVTSATSDTIRGEQNESGVIVHRARTMNFFDTAFGIPFPIPGISFALSLYREIRNSDAVHIHDVFYLPSWMAGFLAWCLRKPVVLTQHVAMVEHKSKAVMRIERMVYQTFGRMLFHVAHRIIVYNRIVCDFLLSYGVPAGKIVEIRNGIDLKDFQGSLNENREEVLREYGIPTDKPIALFVGRYVSKKGFDVLFQSRRKEYTIVFAGSGNVPPEWRKESGVCFIGPLTREQLAPLYRSADVFVFPAVGEIFTLVMQEAMASGLPVITTDDAGYRTYDVDRALIRFISPTPEDISKAILEVLSDKELSARMRAYSLFLAHEWFDWDTNIHPVVELYASLAKKTMSRTKKIPNITMVTPYFFPKIGGLENYAYHVARRAHASGAYHVSVITTNHENGKYREETMDGMSVYRLPIAGKLSNTPFHPLWFWQMRRIMKKEQTDLIHAHAPVPLFAETAALAAGSIPFVLTYHSGSMRKGRFPIDLLIRAYEGSLLRMLFAHANVLVPVSQAFFQTPLGKKFLSKSVLIRPGVDTNVFTPSPLPMTEQKIVTYVGRIEHSSSWKGIDQLLLAMKAVLAGMPNVRLELIGSGDAVPFFRSEADRLGIGAEVELLGSKAGEELREAYRRSSVIVLPSVTDAEQSSVVLIEAMASGRPVIGTNVGGTPQIVHHERNGLLVEPKNISALSGAILRVLSDTSLAERLAKGALLSARDVDWSNQMKKYRDVWDALVDV